MKEETARILRYCCEEIERQRDSPLRVYNLMRAWTYAVDQAERVKLPFINHILMLGYLAKPTHNTADYFRRCELTVGDHYPPKWDMVPRLMHDWVDAIHDYRLTPEEAYREFQYIHPFRDGNGRVGKVLYNWLKGTLHDPNKQAYFI